MRVFGYSDTPPPQSNRAVAPEERICVGLLICIFADKLLPDASTSFTNVLGWGQGVVFVPEVGANGGCHVDGGDEAEHAGDHQCGSEPVIHHGALGGNTGTSEQCFWKHKVIPAVPNSRHQPPSAMSPQGMHAFLSLPARIKGTLSKSTVLASIHRIFEFQVGVISWRVCSPSHTALAALPETATDRTPPTHLQRRWRSSLPFVILIVGNVRDSIHNAQEEDLSFLKRLPRVEVIFSLPPHTAFTACVYSKDKNHGHVEKALPGCSQRAAMPRCWNALRKCILALEVEHEGSTEDKFGNYDKCCNNATIRTVVFFEDLEQCRGVPCSMGTRWQNWKAFICCHKDFASLS